jgi:nitroreductase
MSTRKNTRSGTLQSITLPEPVFNRGKTVFEALKNRRTCRNIRDEKIPMQILSDILWAASGVNRRQGPFGVHGRTAGSASNSQEIMVYVALQEGSFYYEPDDHRLMPVAAGDNRRLAIGGGQQETVADAPVQLIYVVDLERFKSAGLQEPGLYDPEVRKSCYYVDTGLVAQNVYMACAALGLASWFHNCDKASLKKKLNLKPDQLPLFGQTIGYADD